MSFNVNSGWSSGYYKGVLDGALNVFDEEHVQQVAVVRQSFHNESYDYNFPQPFFLNEDENEVQFFAGYLQGVVESASGEILEDVAAIYEDAAAEVFHFWAEENSMDYYDERSMSFEMLTFIDVKTRSICNCQWSEL